MIDMQVGAPSQPAWRHPGLGSNLARADRDRQFLRHHEWVSSIRVLCDGALSVARARARARAR